MDTDASQKRFSRPFVLLTRVAEHTEKDKKLWLIVNLKAKSLMAIVGFIKPEETINFNPAEEEVKHISLEAESWTIKQL
jgi:hypothetical protein